MDEKTEELRDIFVDVAGEDPVTEPQTEERGSLAGTDERDVDERLQGVIDRMRERYEFRTDIEDEVRCRIIRGFYDGEDDATLADAVETDSDTVFQARMDLHLLDDDDTDFPFSLSSLRRHRDDGTSAEELAVDFDADEDTVERALLVAETQEAVRRVSGRFQSEFEDILPDAALSIRLTESVQEDGLDEAAEDIETNTSL